MECKLYMFMSTWEAGCGRVFRHSKVLCMCMLALECILTNSIVQSADSLCQEESDYVWICVGDEHLLLESAVCPCCRSYW